MANLDVTCDSDGMAYISLTRPDEVHEVHESVQLHRTALESEVRALDSLVLDFDRRGRLIGIEVTGAATKVLPQSLVSQARGDT